MSNVDIKKIVTPDGTVCNLRDSQCPDVSEAIEAILDGSAPTYALLFVTTETGVTITVSKGQTTLPTQTCVLGEELVFNIPENGTWTVSGSNKIIKTLSITNKNAYYIKISPSIYGVIWDPSLNSLLTRTDDSATFSDPNPYYGNIRGLPSSPFDNLMPWSGIVKETIDGNVFVRIPKFWYKIENTSNSLSIQISDTAQTGFKVSPAHRAFNANDTEKDYVYVGRYKCNSSYGSTTGQTLKTNITRADARSGCAAISSGKSYQMDFAMFWTIRMLYLVEFANWDVQECVGYGFMDKQNTGSTDTMPYHTGTINASRTERDGTQYRYIEGLWDRVGEWCDGIIFSSSSIRVWNDPNDYSDSLTNSVSIGTRATSSGYTTDFIIPTNSDFDWALYPSSVSSLTTSGAIPDWCYYNSSGTVLNIGGSSTSSTEIYYGMFFLQGSNTQTSKNGYISARLILYP